MQPELNAGGALTVYALGVPLVLLLILVEAIISAWRRRDYYQHQDTMCSLGLLGGNIVVNVGLKTLTLGFYLYLYQFRLFDLSTLLPMWAVWLLSFILIDFTFYWFHRLSHRMRWLWSIHMNHHSSEEMNFVVAFRQPWLAPIAKVPFFAGLPLIGLDPTITLVAGVAATLWGVVGHTKLVGKLWWPIEYVFNTPSHHRVHHGSNPEYIDKNYGNIFIIWDRLFGTFEPERAPVRYGLRTNVGTFNPIKITFMDWAALFQRMREAGNLRDALGYFFGPPNWQPAASADAGSPGFPVAEGALEEKA